MDEQTLQQLIERMQKEHAELMQRVANLERFSPREMPEPRGGTEESK